MSVEGMSRKSFTRCPCGNWHIEGLDVAGELVTLGNTVRYLGTVTEGELRERGTCPHCGRQLFEVAITVAATWVGP